ncbi:homoserine dehydrogenase [Tyzzerella sp. OttesenSCG-928-J15]|nr:homoserine dehydrogenase [Tyzzerella sp. OttesenSCG-928-J15]
MNVALLGHGTVGSGVFELITERESRNYAANLCGVNITKILVRNLENYRDLEYFQLFTDSFDDIIESEIDTVIETMGGVEPAFSYISHFLKKGVTVITANKDLIAEKGDILFELADKNDAMLYYEASVGGGIPIIKPLCELLASDDVLSLKGIVNGTTNFILSKMTSENLTYGEALKQAQEQGFAESNPYSDVEGLDAVRKISILSRLAFKKQVSWKALPVKGITAISQGDISYADKNGLKIKLIGYASQYEGGVYASVRPVMLPSSSSFASVENEYNMIELNGKSMGTLHFYGKGAGKYPTSTAIISDLSDSIARVRKEKFNNLDKAEILPYSPEKCSWIVPIEKPFDVNKCSASFVNYRLDYSMTDNARYLKTAGVSEKDLVEKLNALGLSDSQYYMVMVEDSAKASA